MKLRTLILKNDGITVKIDGGMVEFLETLVKQSKLSFAIDENVEVKKVLSLLNARQIYNSFGAPQYIEEKKWVPKLLKMFKAIS
jgi:hypothetical protein